MSRIQIDQLIDDDEEEVCPLCVEELDLDDRGFRPCPCGYQICRFCHHNIKTNMNGLCPACRRPYEDKNIVMIKPTVEEAADYHKRQAQRQKKTAVAKQKEAQRREADTLSRKHLAGLRVVQKNLVYVTGLSPTTQESKLLETLRGPDYFGQYGKIIKIVVSKAKDTSHHHQSVGVYVTFARKEDAQACIDAVDGSANGERTLRAQHGTTKYCSAYLRNETCNNKSCMFLHEPGDEGDRFTRQDLSALNISQSNHPHNPLNPQQHAPVQQAPIAAATQMQRDESSEGSHSADGPALPSSASWASKPVQLTQDRRPSRATTSSEASPAVSHSAPSQSEAFRPEAPKAEPVNVKQQPTPLQAPSPALSQPSSSSQTDQLNRLEHLENVVKFLSTMDWTYEYSNAHLPEKDQERIRNMPLLLDPYGGEKLRLRREKEAKAKEAQAQAVAQATAAQVIDAVDAEDDPASGSLQLGGEPEEQHNTPFGRAQHAIGPPPLPSGLGQNLFGDDLGTLGLNGRDMSAQQPQHLLIQRYKDNPNASNLLNSFQSNQQSQQMGQGQGSLTAPSHARQTSKFSFANDTGTASTSVKPVPTQKFMNQQNAMMPQNAGPFSHQGPSNQFYTSSVQGPPPGLKTTGTPPVSGGGMFGQGHGFATGGLGYGANATGRNNSNEEMMQRLLRGQRADGHGADTGKRESMFPTFLQSHSSTSSTPAPTPGLHNYLYGSQPGAYQDSGPQKKGKKSKKHRHANTSSSGGGGPVDVSDPSILQARLHHGGGPMGGQGVYGGQGQGTEPGESVPHSRNISTDDPFSPAPATHSEFYLSRRGTPTVPPGFEGSIGSKPTSRAATPRNTTPIKPALPLLPTPQKSIATPDTGESVKNSREPSRLAEESMPDKQVTAQTIEAPAEPASVSPEPPKDLLKKAVKPATRKNSTATATFSQIKASVPSSTSATPAASRTVSSSSFQQPATPQKAEKIQPDDARKKTETAPNTAKTSKGSSSSSKRQHPGKLDIPSATASIEADKKPYKLVAGSVPQTPATVASTGSPVKKAASKVLRVVQTPKTEISGPVSASSVASNIPPPLPTGRLASRQASIGSINIPGTPSVDVSDVASLASTSVSRANSPPPPGKTKVVASRTKTKSQMKKERQERGKQMTAETVEEAVGAKPVDEVVQEPILGRKKKAKKPSKTPTAAVMSKEAKAAKEAKEASGSEPPAMKAEEEPRPPTPPPQAEPSPIQEETIVEEPKAPEPYIPSPAETIAELSDLEDLMQASFFKGTTPYPKGEIAAADVDNLETPIPFTPEDLEDIAKDVPVHLGGADGRDSSRALVVDQGVLFGISKSMEQLYLEIDARIKATTGAARYRHISSRDPKRTYPSKLPSFASGLQNATNAANRRDGSGSNEDTLKRAPFDDAASYINQWVIPTDPTAATYTGRPTQNTTQVTTAGIPGISLPLEEASELLDGHIIRSLAATEPRTFITQGMTFEDLEKRFHTSRKEAEQHEKALLNSLKKNRKIVPGGGR